MNTVQLCQLIDEHIQKNKDIRVMDSMNIFRKLAINYTIWAHEYSKFIDSVDCAGMMRRFRDFELPKIDFEYCCMVFGLRVTFRRGIKDMLFSYLGRYPDDSSMLTAHLEFSPLDQVFQLVTTDDLLCGQHDNYDDYLAKIAKFTNKS